MENTKIFKVKEVKLIYNTASDILNRPVVHNSEEAYQLFMKHWDIDSLELQEQAKVIFLNGRAAVLGLYNLSTGGTSGTVIDIKLVMTAALKINASKIIIAHNHPSGTLRPSDSDIKITEKLVLAGKLLDISVDDHLIITASGYVSLSDKGLI